MPKVLLICSLNWINVIWQLLKVIPKDEVIEKNLNTSKSCLLAHGRWGWTKKGIHLATNAFNREDVNWLSTVINRKFGLNSTVHNTGRIFLPVKYAQILWDSNSIYGNWCTK